MKTHRKCKNNWRLFRISKMALTNLHRLLYDARDENKNWYKHGHAEEPIYMEKTFHMENVQKRQDFPSKSNIFRVFEQWREIFRRTWSKVGRDDNTDTDHMKRIKNEFHQINRQLHHSRRFLHFIFPYKKNFYLKNPIKIQAFFTALKK